MTNTRFQFDFTELKLSKAHIESFIGYKEGESHEPVSEIIRDILEEAKEMCDIRAEYNILPVLDFNDSEKSIGIKDQVFSVNNIVFGQLKESESIAVFLSTAGDEIGTRSRNAMTEGDLLKGYIYDVVGSEIVEAAADIMQNALETEMAAEGKRITNRYSPGYCGWNVAEQHKLFRFMPYNFCGIRLTSAALMDPVKSLSGFIGIGNNVKRLPYTCSVCDMKDCIYRRVKRK
jgi:hypothetical protein